MPPSQGRCFLRVAAIPSPASHPEHKAPVAAPYQRFRAGPLLGLPPEQEVRAAPSAGDRPSGRLDGPVRAIDPVFTSSDASWPRRDGASSLIASASECGWGEGWGHFWVNVRSVYIDEYEWLICYASCSKSY